MESGIIRKLTRLEFEELCDLAAKYKMDLLDFIESFKTCRLKFDLPEQTLLEIWKRAPSE